MAGYLEQYGAGEERRGKIVKTLVISLVALIVLGGTGFFVFHNYRQEHQVKRFFCTSGAKGLPGGLRTVGAHGIGPSRVHYERFPKRLGPARRSSGRKRPAYLQEPFLWERCDPHSRFRQRIKKEKLWVAREDLTIGFSPLPGCPPPR